MVYECVWMRRNFEEKLFLHLASIFNSAETITEIPMACMYVNL